MEEKIVLELELLKTNQEISNLLVKRKPYIVGPNNADINHLDKINENAEPQRSHLVFVDVGLVFAGIVLVVLGVVISINASFGAGLLFCVLGGFVFVLFLILAIVAGTKNSNALAKLSEINQQLRSDIALKKELESRIAILEMKEK